MTEGTPSRRKSVNHVYLPSCHQQPSQAEWLVIETELEHCHMEDERTDLQA